MLQSHAKCCSHQAPCSYSAVQPSHHHHAKIREASKRNLTYFTVLANARTTKQTRSATLKPTLLPTTYILLSPPVPAIIIIPLIIILVIASQQRRILRPISQILLQPAIALRVHISLSTEQAQQHGEQDQSVRRCPDDERDPDAEVVYFEDLRLVQVSYEFFIWRGDFAKGSKNIPYSSSKPTPQHQEF